MELLQNSGFIAFLIFLVNLIFLAGFWFRKLKDAVSRKEMEIIVNEEVTKQLANHCPFHNDIKDLKDWKKSHTEWGEKTQGITHDSLNEIKINLKMVCKTLGIEYVSANGK